MIRMIFSLDSRHITYGFYIDVEDFRISHTARDKGRLTQVTTPVSYHSLESDRSMISSRFSFTSLLSRDVHWMSRSLIVLYRHQFHHNTLHLFLYRQQVLGYFHHLLLGGVSTRAVPPIPILLWGTCKRKVGKSSRRGLQQCLEGVELLQGNGESLWDRELMTELLRQKSGM